MTIFEKNLEVLSKYYTQMDVLIRNIKEQDNDTTIIEEEIAYDGSPVLKIKTEDAECYLNGKRNMREPAQMWYEGLGELQTNATVFMMGIGNITYLQELIERTKKKIIILIYEPSVRIFLHFLERVSLEKWMEKHVIAFWVEGLEGMEEKNMESFLDNIIRYEMLPYNRNLIIPNYDVLFPEKAINFMELCKKVAVRGMVLHNTRVTFSDVIAKNILRNMPYLCDGYKTTQLVDVIPRDIPGIVVAAGPSLNKNIHDLKEAKGRAFIIAVDTAIKPLIKAGIIPDMFVCIDGIKPLDLIKDEKAKNIPLLAGMGAASDVLAYHAGKKFFYNEGYSVVERILLRTGMNIGRVETGGSVATHAFSLLHKIGITRIILVGQDLAFTGNKSHADGTFEEKMQEVDTKNYIMVKGNYEEEVPTRLDFKQFLDWYDMYIAGCQERIESFRVINATEGGAYIQNTEIMTLKEAIAKECKKEVDIGACLEQLSPMLSEEQRIWSVEYLQGIPEEFEEIKKMANQIKSYYQKLDKICNKKNIDTKEYLSVLKKIEKGIKKIEEEPSYQLITMTLVNAQYILQNEEYLAEGTIQKEGKEISRKGILYMQNVYKCAELLKELAQDSLEKCNH